MLGRLAILDARERTLLLAGFGWVLGARAALLSPLGSFPDKQRVLDALCARLTRIRPCTVDEAVWAITASARRVPGTRCLAWALALRGLLGQAGMRSELRIGVAPADRSALKAHAWVACGGRTLSWGDDIEGYNELRPSAVAS